MMEELAFNDWPSQPVDLSGSNPWLPAYGFQPPTVLLDKDDFLGNPDADLFLNNVNSAQYVYLETILEETSDDLRSESDKSESRTSPVGWLATDSETGSVIRIDSLDDADCESDREMACKAKKRKIDTNLLGLSDEESSYSLSRSSSLLQFENLEKQCQDLSSSSPSILSGYSFDSLECQQKITNSPDSLDYENGLEFEYYKTFKIDVPTKKSYHANIKRNIFIETSDLFCSDEAIEGSGPLELTYTVKHSRSLESLRQNTNDEKLKNSRDKTSVENLSEDSGYSDTLVKSSSSFASLGVATSKLLHISNGLHHDNLNHVNFGAYDGNVYTTNTPNHFGISYQDLSHLEQYSNINVTNVKPGISEPIKSNKKTLFVSRQSDVVNITDSSESTRLSKYKTPSASEPNLLQQSSDLNCAAAASNSFEQKFNYSSQSCFQTLCVTSVPRDLNLFGDNLNTENSSGHYITQTNPLSIATINCDLADISNDKLSCDETDDMIMSKNVRRARDESTDSEKILIKLRKDDSSSISSSGGANTSFKREGSYQEAMGNRVDLSDDEYSSTKFDRYGTGTIKEFDKQILKAISETSIQSFGSNKDLLFISTPVMTITKRNVLSTPNLSLVRSNSEKEVREYVDAACQTSNKRYSAIDLPRKSSLMNRSTSTSGMSENDDKTLTPTKSISGSTSSKGVHFCPVVAELNWRDESESTGRDSSYSLSSTPETEEIKSSEATCVFSEVIKEPQKVIRPIPRKISSSQPSLVVNNNKKLETNTLEDDDAKYTFIPLKTTATSQPEVHTLVSGMPSFQLAESTKVCTDADGMTSNYQQPGVETEHWTPTANSSHVFNNNKSDVNVVKAVSSMEPAESCRNSKPARTGKLGGFFSRLTSFRFSTRKSNDKKPKQNKKHDTKQNVLLPEPRLATKEDYIYIPLKGPLDETRNSSGGEESFYSANLSNNVIVNSKPPLPKMPPRVVGASVKKRSDSNAQSTSTERRTIDSGDVLPRPMEPMGLIETDLDTEVTVITSGAHVKTRSLMNLGAEAPSRCLAAPTRSNRPHKSMEFLLDKQNLKVVEPPENELQKGERVMSEHELRVQRSLQKLTVPDWYKQAQIPTEGFLLRKNSTRENRWTGTSSKTTSLSSLGSNSQSPTVLSPTPHSQPFVRWSLSKLNSTVSSPCASTRSSFNARQTNGSISPLSLRSSFSYRQPYLGWRSQERLSRPRTPAERLANTLISQSNQTPPPPSENREIQSSIKEVTSAIVHYVSGLKPEDSCSRSLLNSDRFDGSNQGSRSVSPRGSQKLCWLESSFVGTRPLDTPQTPLSLAESQTTTPIPPTTLRLDFQNEITNLTHDGILHHPSPGSTTLEDVLDSLLGLPSSARAASPSLQVTVSANTSPSRVDEELQLSEQVRRRSEGSEPASKSSSTSRRASLHSSPVLRCRNSRCGKVAAAASAEGLAFKNCHNCSYTYCSRTCRREHWEKHRKSCLFSRVGTLCRHIIAAIKSQPDTLLRLSIIARRGYLAHGLGAVKCFFSCPEDAEKFLNGEVQCLGEPTFIRWADLLPSEMGSQLYAELVKMCKNYNPDSKLVLYVSVCVISEAPAVGAVKWERQLVSRCAKMRLSKDLHIPEKETENIETLILTSTASAENLETARKICFDNIQRHLLERGISLKRQYPEIYKQLCVYVEGNCDKFPPVTVYPRDSETGKPFMCIIMPDADPESLKQVTTAGVKVRTVDILQDY